MFPYLTLIKYGIPFIIGGLLFGGAAWKIQDWRYGGDRVKLEACSSANVENATTIEQLKKQAENFNKTCEQRIASKDSTIKKLRQIDELHGGNTNGQEMDADSGDSVLNELRGMFKLNSKN